MIPLKLAQLDFSKAYPKRIIVHHTYELAKERSNETIFDNTKFQTHYLQNWYYKFKGTGFLPYHYVIEKVMNDYQIVVQMPFLTKCIFEDLEETYHSDLHIAILGNYDEDIADNLLYNTLAMKLIVPNMRAFKLREKDIFFHREISSNKDETCPGEFFVKAKLLSAVRRNTRNYTVSRTK